MLLFQTLIHLATRYLNIPPLNPCLLFQNKTPKMFANLNLINLTRTDSHNLEKQDRWTSRSSARRRARDVYINFCRTCFCIKWQYDPYRNQPSWLKFLCIKVSSSLRQSLSSQSGSTKPTCFRLQPKIYIHSIIPKTRKSILSLVPFLVRRHTCHFTSTFPLPFIYSSSLLRLHSLNFYYTY